MEFTQIEPFEIHLKETLVHHLPPVYGVALSNSFERKVIITKLLEKIGGKPIYFKQCTASLEDVLNEINSPDLLCSKRVFIYDGMGEPRREMDLIVRKLRALPSNTCVIWASDVVRFYPLMDKKMILLDLSRETTRAHAMRIERWLTQEVRKRGKRLTKEAQACLLGHFMLHFEHLMQEVQKLATYTGGGLEIDLKAVRAICNVRSIQTTNWEVAKGIVWNEKGKSDCPSLHLSMEELFPFLGQLRYHLQLGLVITSCLKRGREEEIARAYPKFSARVLAHYKQRAHLLSVHYFKKGLQYLFELQLQALDQGVDPSTIITQFTAKLKQVITNG